MKTFAQHTCTICGGLRTADERWILVTESTWEDKLKILRWNDRLAARNGVHPVCGPLHVRALVIHWMTTESLDYPFAHRAIPFLQKARRYKNLLPEKDDGEISAARIGELAVHRESVGRALQDHPQFLNAILDELSRVLRHENKGLSSEVESEEGQLCEATQAM